MPKLIVKVDHAACSGIGSCVDVTAKFFQLYGENRSVVISNETGEAEQELTVSDEEAQEILLAAESCPMVAISVFDESGAQLYG